MGVRFSLIERHLLSAPRRALRAAALLLVGGCFASFQACSTENEPVASSSQTQALQTNGDPAGNRGGLGRTGEYYDTTLTTALVSSNTFRRASTAYVVDGPIYAQPTIAQNVLRSDGYKTNLLIIATTSNSLYAFDADHIGDPVWHRSTETFGLPVMIGSNSSGAIEGNPIHCGNLGNTGILSTPYVDTSSGTVYVVSESLPSDLSTQNYTEADPPVFTLWALDLASGNPKGNPVVLHASSNGVNFDPYVQIQRPALTPVTVGARSFLLIGFSSSCDTPSPYYGWVISQEITNPSSLDTGATSSYCPTCDIPAASGPAGGIWQSGMGFAVDNSGAVYFQNGNTLPDNNSYQSSDPGTYSNTVVKLTVTADGTLSVADFFTPDEQAYLSQHDLDLGVSGVAWLGGNDGSGPNVLLSGSKQGKVYLLDPANLGQFSEIGDNVLGEIQGSCAQFDNCCGDSVTQPANCQGDILQPDDPNFDPNVNCGACNVADQQNWPHIHGAPVYWSEKNYIYLMGQYDFLRRLKLNPTSRTFDVTSQDSFAFADTNQIAPTAGYGGLMSISYNSNDGDGILWVNARSPKDVQGWGTNVTTYTATHSGAELSPGAFYAVDATQMTRLFADAPAAHQSNAFLVSKFTTPTVYGGRVYLATMSNEVLVYCNDQDGDGICDTMDNCPTVANADQSDSNYDAEQLLGSPVLGDACDPNATNSLLALPPDGTNGDGATDGVPITCPEVLLGCGSSSSSGNTTCARRFNTNLTFSAHIGNSAGTAPAASGTAAPAFCKCTAANQYLCLYPNTGNCDGADDLDFPTLSGGSAGNWTAISQLANGSNQWFSPIGLQHVEPWNAYAGSTARLIWDFPYDLTRLGANANAGLNLCNGQPCALQGELWSHMLSFTPGSGENALATNLNNNYVSATAQFMPVEQFQLEPCTGPQYVPWLWGQQGQGQQGWSEDPVWMMPLTSGVGAQVSSDGVGADISSSFTSNALSVLESLVGLNGSSFLLDADGARNLGSSKVLGAVLNADPASGNVTVNDALVQSGTQIDAQAAAGGATSNTISHAVSEALDPETGLLYALTNNAGTESLVAMDVAGALNNFTYAQTSVAISGMSFATPLSMVYSEQNGLLYLLDEVSSCGGACFYSLRLSTITTAGVMTRLWQTSSVSTPSQLPTHSFLSATPNGNIVVSLQSGTTTAEAMVVDKNGNPIGSYQENGSMRTRALIGSGQGIWFPLETTIPGSVNTALTPTYQPLLLSGICGSSWLLAHAGSSGELATSKSSCNAIYNGGFETGTFLDWTATGQSESISTSNPHSGSYSAMLGSTSATNGDSTVEQTFTVPSGGGTLSFYWSSTCPDTVTFDWFTATLQNTSGTVLATLVPKTCAASSAWTLAGLNLSRFAGQTLVLVLTSHDDGYPLDPTYSFVDDITVQ